MNAFEAALQQKRDADRAKASASLVAEPAVRDLAETIVRRLEAGVVNPGIYLAEMLETLERKHAAIAEAHLAGELHDDQARHSTRIAEQQIELVKATMAANETRTDDELRAEHAQLEEADFYTGHKLSLAEMTDEPAEEPRRLPYEIVVAISGDRAHAETAEQALAAADALCRDHQSSLGTQGALKAARDSVYITENGTYAGILTAFARLGQRTI